MAVFWAVACLVFSAYNDFVFKAYARKPRSNGYFITIIGIVWLITSCCFTGGLPQDWSATILWGVVSGVFSIAGNILMLEAMRTLDAGVCSTIYRLNMVPAVIGAYILLGENISRTGYLGIFCALLAVIGFLPQKQAGVSRKLALAGFIVMILASLMRAGLGLSYRYGFIHGADKSWVVVLDSLFWIIGGIIYAGFERTAAENPEDGKTRFRKLIFYGLLSGLLVAGITLTLAAALAVGKASIVLPIAQMSFILTGMLGAVILKEKITLLKIIAMLLGAVSIILLSLQNN